MTRPLLRFGLLLGSFLLIAAPAVGDKSRARDLPGTYYDQYNVLFGETGEIRIVEKYLEIEATQDPLLFRYSQCWRLVEGGDWNHERGGLVITRRGRKTVEFSVVEAEFAVEEGSTGFMLGRMSRKNRLALSYHGLGRGIVFHMEPERVEDAALDEFTCPLE